MITVCYRFPCPSPGCQFCSRPMPPYTPLVTWDPAPPHGPRLGWECPRCHKMHAPWVPACDCAPAKREEAP